MIIFRTPSGYEFTYFDTRWARVNVWPLLQRACEHGLLEQHGELEG